MIPSNLISFFACHLIIFIFQFISVMFMFQIHSCFKSMFSNCFMFNFMFVSCFNSSGSPQESEDDGLAAVKGKVSDVPQELQEQVLPAGVFWDAGRTVEKCHVATNKG